jgi:hypothetical protein
VSAPSNVRIHVRIKLELEKFQKQKIELFFPLIEKSVNKIGKIYFHLGFIRFLVWTGLDQYQKH